MPELPEVEVTRIGLLSGLPGRRVTKISWSNKKLRSPVPRTLLTEHILGSSIQTIDRRAKYLLFRMTNGSTMVIHLGMTGKLSLVPALTTPAAHDHLRLLLDNSMELRFNDARRFGSINVWPAEAAKVKEDSFSNRIGVEPFCSEFNVAYLLQQARSRKTPIKNFLMDARIVAGIGNIYANEILYAVSLHPQTPVCSVSSSQWKMVIESTRLILNKAIRAGGSTISDFLGTSGNPGYFQVHFQVYNRAGEKCNRCADTILRNVISGRAAFYCPCCQQMEKDG